jgi:hypothetical protein
MKFTAEFMLSVILALGSGAGAYTAIRADLATLHERTAVALDTARTANQRIDQLQAQHK